MLSGHTGPVTCVLPLRDDDSSSMECNSVMTASDDKTMRVSGVCVYVCVSSVCVLVVCVLVVCVLVVCVLVVCVSSVCVSSVC